MTVSLDHPVSYPHLAEVKRQLGCANLDIYFVVPKDVFDSFPKQRYKNKDGKDKALPVRDMKQHVLCMNVKM